MNSKKIVIMHISEFGGHRKAAENIKGALQHKGEKSHIITVNGLGYFYPRGEKVVELVYKTVIRYFPHLWGRIYDRQRVIKNLSPAQKVVNKFAFRKLSRLIHNSNPSCIVATQAFPCGVVADYKKEFNLDLPLIAVVTDYHPHRFWVHSEVDRYVVACSEAKDLLIKEGIEASKISVVGIPISIDFSQAHSKEEIAQKFDLALDKPSVLIMGGGLGIGPIEKIALQLDKLKGDFQIVVVCGKNKGLYRWFRRHSNKFHKPLAYFGFVRIVNKLMEFCDIIVTKSGGVTISEALTKNLAIIITNPIPGQEELNVKHLLNKKAVLRAPQSSDVVGLVERLINNPKEMDELKKNAKNISVVDSSLRIVDLIHTEIERAVGVQAVG